MEVLRKSKGDKEHSAETKWITRNVYFDNDLVWKCQNGDILVILLKKVDNKTLIIIYVQKL